MKGLFFDGRLRYREDLPQPRSREDEALVRVIRAGICRTDLEILQGYMGFTGIPGHEFTGVVETCHESRWIGSRVVGEINCVCHRCDHCRSGRENHCENRTVVGISGKDGAFADYLTLPIENLHVLPDTIPDEEAVFVEPVAAAFRILEQIPIGVGDRVILVGDGRLGLVTAQVIRGSGAAVTVIGHHPENLDLLRGRGIETFLESEAAGLDRADVVIDCSGSPSGFKRSFGLVRPGGRFILKSTLAAPLEMSLVPLVIDEIVMVGSRCGPFAPAIAALAGGDIQVSSLIGAIYSLEEGVAACREAGRSGARKVLLKMD